MIDEKRLNQLFAQFETINANPSAAAVSPCATWIALRPTVVELISVLDGLALIFPQAKVAAEALQAIEAILDALCPQGGNVAASGQRADELLNRLRAATQGGPPAPAAPGSPCEKWASVRPIVVEIISVLRGLASLSPVLGKAADVLDSLRALVDQLCGTAAAGSLPSAALVSLTGRSPAGQSASRARTFKMGRKRPIARGPRLSLRNYIMRAMPAPPLSCDYTAAASSAIGEMYLNDSLGDCVIAGMAHIVGVLTGNAGMSPYLYSQSDIIALYSAIGGYDPNAVLVPGPDGPYNPTDQGCDEQTALNYWQSNGAPAGSTHKIAGWLAVNPADPNEYRTALWLFENLYFGFEMPNQWITPFPSVSGFVWNVAGPPVPQNGHCVAGVGYTVAGVKIATWGISGLLTDAAIAKYCDQSVGGDLYTVVSQDALNQSTGKAPNGFDWSQLVADFDSMGGNVTP
jgi:hypothetical protein